MKKKKTKKKKITAIVISKRKLPNWFHVQVDRLADFLNSFLEKRK